MSTIRPDLPALPSVRPDIGAAQDVRAAFFRAALDQVRAVGPTSTHAQTRTSEPQQRPSDNADAPTRTMRPGSLLDIRV